MTQRSARHWKLWPALRMYGKSYGKAEQHVLSEGKSSELSAQAYLNLIWFSLLGFYRKVLMGVRFKLKNFLWWSTQFARTLLAISTLGILWRRTGIKSHKSEWWTYSKRKKIWRRRVLCFFLKNIKKLYWSQTHWFSVLSMHICTVIVILLGLLRKVLINIF